MPKKPADSAKKLSTWGISDGKCVHGFHSRSAVTEILGGKFILTIINRTQRKSANLKKILAIYSKWKSLHLNDLNFANCSRTEAVFIKDNAFPPHFLLFIKHGKWQPSSISIVGRLKSRDIHIITNYEYSFKNVKNTHSRQQKL